MRRRLSLARLARLSCWTGTLLFGVSAVLTGGAAAAVPAGVLADRAGAPAAVLVFTAAMGVSALVVTFARGSREAVPERDAVMRG
ncbi:hypothetical protein [Actinoplanes sp. NPDC051851]|uniref:hypothetical protein n=1 Tax=Actinoplanes sp. NPDC051851 TaxID=3154753 RepID=UPI00343830A1